MQFGERLFIALVIVLVDMIVFAIPLTAFFAVYLILARPSWFKGWVEKLYTD